MNYEFGEENDSPSLACDLLYEAGGNEEKKISRLLLNSSEKSINF